MIIVWRFLKSEVVESSSGANPYMGNIGDICDAEEAKIEFNCKKELYKTAVDTIKRIHPYEKPVINVIPLIISIVERSER